jgi:hypothetical protein
MKDKMRCASCGAMFKPSKSSQTKCERCEKREREQRAAAKHAGGTQAQAVATTQPVKISGPGASVLGAAAPTVYDAVVPPPPDTGGYGQAAWREEERRRLQERQEKERQALYAQKQAERAAQVLQIQSKPDKFQESGVKARAPKGTRPQQALKPPKSSKSPKPLSPKVELTDDLRATIEARYLELAKPVEFDGIRTQIANELSVPKSVVKKAISELRGRMSLPSWWDLQAYTGAETDLERIRIAYVPLLPVPDVGVHKTLATQLGMDPRAVYQGIRRIRAEMRLPQYNPPAAHGDTDSAPVASLKQSATQPTDAMA